MWLKDFFMLVLNGGIVNLVCFDVTGFYLYRLICEVRLSV